MEVEDSQNHEVIPEEIPAKELPKPDREKDLLAVYGRLQLEREVHTERLNNTNQRMFQIKQELIKQQEKQNDQKK